MNITPSTIIKRIQEMSIDDLINEAQQFRGQENLGRPYTADITVDEYVFMIEAEVEFRLGVSNGDLTWNSIKNKIHHIKASRVLAGMSER